MAKLECEIVLMKDLMALCDTIFVSFFSQHSNLLNQARLTVLKSRDDHVKIIVEEAKTRLDQITKDTTKWKKVLQDLITQVGGILSEYDNRISRGEVGGGGGKDKNS